MKRLCRDVPPAAVKVWLYHFARSGSNDASYPKLETIAADTNQNLQTVKLARSWLRENGWLELAGYRTFGRASFPMLRCVFPGPKVENPPSVTVTQGGKSTLGRTPRRTENPPSRKVGNPPTEVDLNLGVDERPEVQAPQQFTFSTMQTPVLPIDWKKPTDLDRFSAGTLWKEICASLQGRVNPHSFSTWFSPLRAESIASQRLRVSVPRPMWVRRLEETYGDVLREALAEIKRPELTLEFVVRESAAARTP